MAPLLGRKPFPLAKPLPPGEPGERFVIPHTQEAFRTREYPLGPAPRGDGVAEWWGGGTGGSAAVTRRGGCPRAERVRRCWARNRPPPLLRFSRVGGGAEQSGSGAVGASPGPVPGGKGGDGDDPAHEGEPGPGAGGRLFPEKFLPRFGRRLPADGRRGRDSGDSGSAGLGPSEAAGPWEGAEG